MKNVRTDLSIVLSGEAGQGIQTLERLLMKMFKLSGRHVFSFSEFMSRIRGGNNSTEIRVSPERADSFLGRIDVFVPFSPGSMARFHERITGDTVIISDPAFLEERYRGSGYTVIEIPFLEIAKEIGGKTFLNLVVMGLFAGLFGINEDGVQGQVGIQFFRVADDVIDKNIEALKKGFEAGREIALSGNIEIPPAASHDVSGELLINGAEIITLGGIAGGCNFVSSYPMSPSTDVLVNFAKFAEEFNIVVEQAEDEICAVNMAIASWYAGGRAMVTTSGGGFALMTEGLSLAGALESPLVIHVGQRPGPATGMPTRTEQGDLLFALFSGHGEFPRIIYAPGNYSQGFDLTRKAFHMADKYQVPVILLTDQYFLDSNGTVPGVNVDNSMSTNIITETDSGNRRYKVTESGISPRGIPGYGTGIVCLDSDEHDEGGYITEDFAVRVAQVNKRMGKLQSMGADNMPPDLYGPDDYRCLVVSWGSTLNGILEAIKVSGRSDIALLHYSQVYPLHENTKRYLERGRFTAIVENNYSSQFGALIRMHTGFEFNRKILKYNGMPFSVEELAEEFKKFA
ncbi:MAG TPA: 2-oxoacid:acceptor oxidoreductase subunit alpha [Spirochaetota bacterium]|nr:2-oxoacid:acceptor oxidoreductase subunit alpha [Spirochaetota bacterium]HPV39714.1 2-oxoacid:acceptor oxidoreductase subunit alpha [Spirochaetota bacterium]